MGELLAFSALFMFSSNVIVTKIASNRVNLNLGFLVSVAVNVVFSLLLLGFQFVFTHKPFEWNTFGFVVFLLTGFFSTYLGRFLFFETIAKLGPVKASAIQVSNPLFTTLIASFILGEALTKGDILAIPLMLIGLFLVSFKRRAVSTTRDEIAATSLNTRNMRHVNEEKNVSDKFGFFLRSDVLLALLSSLSYAIGNVLRGTAIQHWDQPIIGALLGAIMGLLLQFITKPNSWHFVRDLKCADKKGVLLFVLSGVLTISAQICVIASMWYLPIAIANLITLSTPILVTPFSFFILKNQEGITLQTILGISFVLVGIFLIVLI